MSKENKNPPRPTLDPDEPGMVPGRWYMWFHEGFTFIGQHVRSLGYQRERLTKHTHLLNAGKMMLSEICLKGPGKETKLVPMFPGFWNGIPASWTDYFGPTPWVRDDNE
jgi:hypothetical protein